MNGYTGYGAAMYGNARAIAEEQIEADRQEHDMTEPEGLTREEFNYRQAVLAAERARAMRAAELEAVRARLIASRA